VFLGAIELEAGMGSWQKQFYLQPWAGGTKISWVCFWFEIGSQARLGNRRSFCAWSSFAERWFARF
jgi:hypothetical protein